MTALVVDDARAFKVGDTITVGGDTGLAISAINYSTNTLTIPSTAVADNDVVFCDSLAGSEIARGVLNEFVPLKDEDGVARDKLAAHIVIAGYANPNNVLGDLASVLAATNKLGFIQWADDAGQL